MAQPLKEVPFTDVQLSDDFWSKRIETNRTVTIWHNIEQCEKTGRVANFLRAAGKQPGTHEGFVFNDSDLYKVIEAASYVLATHPDPRLDAKLDEWIAIIAAAQQPDGYLNTYYTLKAPDKRLTNLKDNHEFYCAGHLIEGAVAHHQATGKKSLLDIATKYADFIDQNFGDDKRHDVDGHEEIELALFKLADAAGEPRYQKLGEFFVRERGRSREGGRKLYGPYHQDTRPVDQYDAVIGHAVRQMYLNCAMADMALDGAQPDMRPALTRMWDDMTTGKLYVTGGVGARHEGEAFGEAFELPNENAYAETCAGIGSALWNHRMNLLSGDAKYADEVERVTYNGFLSGISLSGDRYFYVNPLASRGNHHRTPWFPCACCPPNVARYMATVPGRAYATKGDEISVNLYASGEATFTLPAGGKVKLKQQTDYPWDGYVRITATADKPLNLRLRVPAWCEGATVSVDAKPRDATPQRGYIVLDGVPPRDAVELNLPMPVKRIKADPRVKANTGRVALQRGPIVYCAEAIDNGGAVTNLYLPPSHELSAEHRADLLGGVTVLTGTAIAKTEKGGEPVRSVPFTAIPYYAWDHRDTGGAGEMAVWLAEDPAVAKTPPAPTIASKATASASHVGGNGFLGALNDREEVESSRRGPHVAFWPHKGSKEWIQYDFAKPETVGATEIYWFDDVPGGGCKVPKSWKLLYRDGDAWKPVELAGGAEGAGGAGGAGGGYATAKDQFHRVEFKPVRTTALRIEIQLQDGFSGGVMEWRVEGGKAK